MFTGARLTKQQALRTLRRVPDRIVLAVMGRDIDLADANSCLCGWFVREKLAEIQNVGASSTHAGYDVSQSCADEFGGSWSSWDDIYSGVVEWDETPQVIEAAFTQRVDEAVYGRKPARKS